MDCDKLSIQGLPSDKFDTRDTDLKHNKLCDFWVWNPFSDFIKFCNHPILTERRLDKTISMKF